jgi:hypothetical protein
MAKEATTENALNDTEKEYLKVYRLCELRCEYCCYDATNESDMSLHYNSVEHIETINNTTAEKEETCLKKLKKAWSTYGAFKDENEDKVRDVVKWTGADAGEKYCYVCEKFINGPGNSNLKKHNKTSSHKNKIPEWRTRLKMENVSLSPTEIDLENIVEDKKLPANADMSEILNLKTENQFLKEKAEYYKEAYEREVARTDGLLKHIYNPENSGLCFVYKTPTYWQNITGFGSPEDLTGKTYRITNTKKLPVYVNGKKIKGFRMVYRGNWNNGQPDNLEFLVKAEEQTKEWILENMKPFDVKQNCPTDYYTGYFHIPGYRSIFNKKGVKVGILTDEGYKEDQKEKKKIDADQVIGMMTPFDVKKGVFCSRNTGYFKIFGIEYVYDKRGKQRGSFNPWFGYKEDETYIEENGEEDEEQLEGLRAKAVSTAMLNKVVEKKREKQKYEQERPEIEESEKQALLEKEKKAEMWKAKQAEEERIKKQKYDEEMKRKMDEINEEKRKRKLQKKQQAEKEGAGVVKAKGKKIVIKINDKPKKKADS